METAKLKAILRRARLRLIRGKTSTTSDKKNYGRLDNVMKKRHDNTQLSVKSHDLLDILCQLSENGTKKTHRSNELQAAPKTPLNYLCNPGPSLAPIPPHTMASTRAREASDDYATIDLISNAGTLEIPDESNVPNEYEFEILRLRRRVEELEGIVKDRDERNVKAIAMLEDEMQMWRTAMHAHVLPTHGQAQQRIIRIESTLQTLKEKESKFFPPLEIPKRWKK